MRDTRTLRDHFLQVAPLVQPCSIPFAGDLSPHIELLRTQEPGPRLGPRLGREEIRLCTDYVYVGSTLAPPNAATLNSEVKASRSHILAPMLVPVHTNSRGMGFVGTRHYCTTCSIGARRSSASESCWPGMRTQPQFNPRFSWLSKSRRVYLSLVA
ncbi:hypothetical protein EI94DRAFT_1749230, partial [Lactarius quietus]